MITSYRIIFASQFVPENHTTHLLHLIRPGIPPFGLKAQDFFNAFFREDVTATANPFVKAKAMHQWAQFRKSEIRVGGSTQDSIQELVSSAHIISFLIPACQGARY